MKDQKTFECSDKIFANLVCLRWDRTRMIVLVYLYYYLVLPEWGSFSLHSLCPCLFCYGASTPEHCSIMGRDVLLPLVIQKQGQVCEYVTWGHTGPPTRKGQHMVSCFPVTVFKFLIILCLNLCFLSPMGQWSMSLSKGNAQNRSVTIPFLICI